MNTAELKEYLRDVYELESTLYSLNAFYNMLVETKSKIGATHDIPLKRFKSDFEDSDGGFLVIGEFIGIIIGEILVFCLSNEKQAWNKFIMGLINGAVIGLLVFGIIILLIRRSDEKEYKKIEKENRTIQLQNEKNHEKIRWKIKQIECEMNNVTNTYNKTWNILQSYYALDIIYKKYRSFVAISSIYEYFESGICTTLTGYEGAYNLFENEARQNMIITKLDDIIRHLDRIEQNQYMLYSAIKECNERIDRLNGSCSKMLSKMTTLENSNEIMEYNSQITAKNAEATNRIIYYKNILGR